MKPSARKSYGEFKPVIIHDSGRTEIVGQRGHVQRVRPETVFYSGPTEIHHSERGVTFTDRGDAIAYARRVIEDRKASYAAREAEREARHKRYAEQQQ
ncbi:hypothetical protein [Ensifer aridi]|uniref:hypothetical protein n=1 Tax=Ensifer aridi TaxID=1708715 RepID=UPI000A0FBB89|nr:hypothetical protein [Ensifer aridi]